MTIGDILWHSGLFLDSWKREYVKLTTHAFCSLADYSSAMIYRQSQQQVVVVVVVIVVDTYIPETGQMMGEAESPINEVSSPPLRT